VLHSSEEHRVFFGGVVAGRETWVWDEDGTLTGFLVLGESTIDFLYLEPERTGQGIGSALLDHAKERRPGGFTLWTFQQNDGARRFYERHGLRAVRFTEGKANEEKTPDVLYEWGVTPSRAPARPPAPGSGAAGLPEP
jgi:GNAT superfamily N-acetyltransferase